MSASNLDRWIEHLIQQRMDEDFYEYQESKKVTFTIRITPEDQQALANVAEYFGWKKTPFAEAVLLQAVQDAARKIARSEYPDDESKALDRFAELVHPSFNRAGVGEGDA